MTIRQKICFSANNGVAGSKKALPIKNGISAGEIPVVFTVVSAQAGAH